MTAVSDGRAGRDRRSRHAPLADVLGNGDDAKPAIHRTVIEMEESPLACPRHHVVGIWIGPRDLGPAGTPCPAAASCRGFPAFPDCCVKRIHAPLNQSPGQGEDFVSNLGAHPCAPWG
jgi:hypothetical protein